MHMDARKMMGRREVVLGGIAAASLAAVGALAGCTSQQGGPASSAAENTDAIESSKALAIPAASPNPDDQFGVDENINMVTIDSFLGRDDVEYTDMRMIHDPADYAAIGGDSDLTVTVDGFKIVPYPFVGTLQDLPVDGAYEGERLFDVEWAPDGTIASVAPRYEESLQIVEDLFPQDKANFIMCGGAGYAHMMRELLIFLGWDPDRVYNIGGGWDYTGYHPQELVRMDDAGKTHYYTWRADMPSIDFDLLTPINR